MAGHQVCRLRTRVAESIEPNRSASRWRRMAGMALLMLSLGACSQTSTAVPAETAQAVSPKSAPCIQRVPKPYQWEGYNDQLVDACIGPTHYRFPANLFRNQMGPDFQANFSLVVMWPDLQPAEPGKLNGQPMDLVMARVQISPKYVDRVPIETLLERYASKEAFQAEDDPSILAQRDQQPERFGLTPYSVNPERFRAFNAAQAQRLGQKSRAKLENEKDWLLHRDALGRLTTFI
ncbi:MAG: hypothetical protein ACK40L_11270 [Hydrogenophaga sp.]